MEITQFFSLSTNLVTKLPGVRSAYDTDVVLSFCCTGCAIITLLINRTQKVIAVTAILMVGVQKSI